jgi:hypothetical protein
MPTRIIGTQSANMKPLEVTESVKEVLGRMADSDRYAGFFVVTMDDGREIALKPAVVDRLVAIKDPEPGPTS